MFLTTVLMKSLGISQLSAAPFTFLRVNKLLKLEKSVTDLPAFNLGHNHDVWKPDSSEALVIF